MVQISKLTKTEIKETGFNNRSITSKFMKTVLNKKTRDFKKKEELINTLKKEYNKMKNFGVDLNENSQMDRKLKKIGKTTTNPKEESDIMDNVGLCHGKYDEYLRYNSLNYSIPAWVKMENLHEPFGITYPTKILDWKIQNKVPRGETGCKPIDTLEKN